MEETSRIFFLDPKTKALSDAEGLRVRRFVFLPENLKEAVLLSVQEILNVGRAAGVGSTVPGSSSHLPIFFSEHWKEGRPRASYSIPVLIEGIRGELGERDHQAPAHFSFAVPFNLFEAGAVREDHDHYRTLAEIFRETPSPPFELFIYRPTHAVTEWHLFTLSDFSATNASVPGAQIERLAPILTELEASPLFPRDAPRWAQTFFRRKQEILSLEHWQNLFEQRIKVDLEKFSQEFPEGYLQAFSALEEALNDLYRTEAAERNHQLKETLFSFAPALHETPDFHSIIARTALAFFPGAQFILENKADLLHFQKALNHRVLEPETALQVLEGADEYLTRYADYLDSSRPNWSGNQRKKAAH